MAGSTSSSNDNFWINCTADQMTNWTCSMNVYKTLWSNVDPKNQDLKSLSQDAFWGFTMFIGFVVMVALVFSWFLMILWWADEKQYETWKKWVIYSIIWLLLVWFAYAIVRLVQFISAW
jgi:hypothetical protein